MFTEELKKQQQTFLPDFSSGKKVESSEQETLYAPVQQKKAAFKSIDPKSVNGHQKNDGGYKRGSELYGKQDAGTNTQGGAVQKKKKNTSNGPSDEQYKKMTVGKEPISSTSLSHVSEKDEYYTKNTPNLNFEVQFISPLPKELKTKLEVIAFYMLNKTHSVGATGDFYENSSTSFAVSGKGFDLTKLSDAEKAKYGGDTVFEFVRLEDFKDGSNKDKACIQIRELGQHQDIAVDGATKQKHEDYFKKFFTLDPSFSDTKEIERLYSAVYRLPESVLSSIPQTPFKRESVNVDRAGNKHHETIAQHVMNGLGETSITVFDSAFNSADSVRYGDSNAGFFGAFEQAILHEIGHAFNGRKITKALRDDQAASDATSKGRRESIACGERKGKRRECKKIDDKLEKLRAAETDAEAAKAAARTETGYGYDIAADDLYVDKYPDEKSDFRKALEKDGKAITSYAVGDIEENYAELFSLYFVDEARLKKMRPAIHEYFAKNHPKNP